MIFCGIFFWFAEEEPVSYAKLKVQILNGLYKGPFKYYVIKEVGGWGQKMAILDDLQYCKSSKSWVGGPKKVKTWLRNTWMVPNQTEAIMFHVSRISDVGRVWP